MCSLLDFLPHGNDDFAEGDRLRDVALDRLRTHREVLVRSMQVAFLKHLLDHGPDTSDAVRALVRIPEGIDPRVVGAAVRGLAEAGVIRSVGRCKSRRSIAHSRMLDVWAIRDEAAARRWLAKYA